MQFLFKKAIFVDNFRNSYTHMSLYLKKYIVIKLYFYTLTNIIIL